MSLSGFFCTNDNNPLSECAVPTACSATYKLTGALRFNQLRLTMLGHGRSLGSSFLSTPELIIKNNFKKSLGEKSIVVHQYFCAFVSGQSESQLWLHLDMTTSCLQNKQQLSLRDLVFINSNLYQVLDGFKTVKHDLWLFYVEINETM